MRDLMNIKFDFSPENLAGAKSPWHIMVDDKPIGQIMREQSPGCFTNSKAVPTNLGARYSLSRLAEMG